MTPVSLLIVINIRGTAVSPKDVFRHCYNNERACSTQIEGSGYNDEKVNGDGVAVKMVRKCTWACFFF